jgi:hypothetical protein
LGDDRDELRGHLAGQQQLVGVDPEGVRQPHDGVGRGGIQPAVLELAEVGEIDADAGGQRALVQVLGPPELPDTLPKVISTLRA